MHGALIPPAWEDAIVACLAKHPEDRPPSAEALANLLGTGRGSVAKGPGKLRPAVSASKSQRDIRVLLFLAAVLLGCVFIWISEHSRQQVALPPTGQVQAPEPTPIPLPPATPPPSSAPSTPEPAPLTLAPSKTGSIYVNTLPAGATVFLDGESKRLTPMRLENVPLRSTLLALEKDGYVRKEMMINAGPGGLRQPPLIELDRKPIEPPRATPPPVELPRSTPPPPTPSTPRPSATPLPSPPIIEFPPATTLDADTPEAVVKTYVQALMTVDPAAYLELCAPRVDFFDGGMQTHDRIRRDRQKLAERWPVYRVKNLRDISVGDAGKPETKRVAFTYDWEVSNPAKKLERSGTAHDILDLHKTGGRWLITKMRQERVGH